MGMIDIKVIDKTQTRGETIFAFRNQRLRRFMAQTTA